MQFVPPSLDGLARRRPSIEAPLMPAILSTNIALPQTNNASQFQSLQPNSGACTPEAQSESTHREGQHNNSGYGIANYLIGDPFAQDEIHEMAKLVERFRHRYLGLADHYSAAKQDAGLLQSRLSETERHLMEERGTVGRALENVTGLSDTGIRWSMNNL